MKKSSTPEKKQERRTPSINTSRTSSLDSSFAELNILTQLARNQLKETGMTEVPVGEFECLRRTAR